MHFTTTGEGPPLVLVHGIGSSSRIWRPFLPRLAAERRVICLDMPGHGLSAQEPGRESFAGLVARVEAFLAAQGLAGADMAGFSLGGRVVLELARRGRAGAVVALAPGGFWAGWEREYLRWTLHASAAMLRLMRGAVPGLAHLPPARAALLAQLSLKGWAVPGEEVEAELLSIAATRGFDALVDDLAAAPMQEGSAAQGTRRVTIGWGRHDRLCVPAQAERALAAFPGADLRWFDASGHYILWDEPERALALILEGTA